MVASKEHLPALSPTVMPLPVLASHFGAAVSLESFTTTFYWLPDRLAVTALITPAMPPLNEEAISAWPGAAVKLGSVHIMEASEQHKRLECIAMFIKLH